MYIEYCILAMRECAVHYVCASHSLLSLHSPYGPRSSIIPYPRTRESAMYIEENAAMDGPQRRFRNTTRGGGSKEEHKVINETKVKLQQD